MNNYEILFYRLKGILSVIKEKEKQSFVRGETIIFLILSEYQNRRSLAVYRIMRLLQGAALQG